MKENSNLELTSMTLIANSGDARSKAFEALEQAKLQSFEQAEALIEEAKAYSTKAHNAQTELLFKEANGENETVNVLLVHAQDHFMTSLLAIELIEEMIRLRQEIYGGEK